MSKKYDGEKIRGYLTIAFFTLFLLGSFIYVGYLIYQEATGHATHSSTHSDPTETNTCRGLTCN